MWHAYIGTLLTKAALPIIGAAVALVLALSAALWWTTNRLSSARDALALSRADTVQCMKANESQLRTIHDLVAQSDQNRRQRDAALQAQQAALARIAILEQEQDEQTAETIKRVIRVADGDACASAAIPVRLRDAASGDGNQDRDRRGRANRSG